ncbi:MULTISPECIES: hypothetical protein [Megamonas]|uniref:hypothetical protein n=1 Tax=Megamonas TaxID=158846 RepID=UPI00242BFCA6|nr:MULTISPECIES: hypothetical protein [Megamonas]
MLFENEKNLDAHKLNQLKVKIILLEKQNLKTREKTKNEMIRYIRNEIIKIVDE